MRSWFRRILAVAVGAPALVAPACTDSPVEYELYGDYACLTPGPRVGNRELEDDPGYVWTIDDEYAAMAREVPGGFGGLFWGEYEGRGEAGRMNFYLVDLAKEQAAIEAMDRPGSHAIQGQYDYAQLKSCYDALRWEDPTRSIWQFEGLTMTDINEGLNRIVLGITDLSTEPDLRALIHEIGVPQGMILVEERQPPVIR